MSEIKVSVIVPVYNAGKYLDRALESICNQTLGEIEIICVDDGSEDNSREIIRGFAVKDERIQLIEQKNLFAGVARNNGFAQAKGEYVVFWDSDDFFEEKALEIMYDRITQDGADICLCDGYKYFTDSDKNFLTDEFVKYGIIPENLPFNKNDIPDKIFNLGANVPWNKMFRTAFIRENNLQFQNLKKANDTYFVLMAIFLAERITCVRKRLIHYRCDSDASLTSVKTNIPPCAFEAYGFLKNELEKREDFTEENKKSFVNRAARGMLRVLHLPMSQADYEAMGRFFKERGFAELGITCDEELYDSGWVYEDVHSVLTRNPTEHLIYKFSCARESKDKIKSRSIRFKERLEKEQKIREKTEKLNTKLDGKLTDTKNKLSDTKKQLKEKEKELAAVKKEKAAVEKSFTALRRKWYVRLFVKIENILKGRKKPKAD